MAYLEARAGLARAGVTYAGWCAPRWRGYLAGVERTSALLYQGFEIVHALDAPATATIVVNGASVTPTEGQRVDIMHATPNEVLFSGFVVRRKRRVQRNEAVQWVCECVDTTWRLDMAPHPVFQVGRIGVNSLCRYIFDTWADSSFSAGLIDQALGDVEGFSADGSETILEVVQRLAKQVGAYVRVNSYERTVDLFTAATAVDGNAASWGNASKLEELQLEVDASQIRSQVRVVGGGGICTATAAGASTIAVDDLSAYSDAGGTVIVPGGTATYTGRSAASGAGTLTGVSGLGVALAEGVRVRVLVTDTDSAAAADLAAAMGEGDGIVEHWIDDDRLTHAEAATVALSDLAKCSTAMQVLTGEAGRDRWLRPGQVRTAAITVPLVVSEDFMVRSVRSSARGVVHTATGGPIVLSKKFEAGRTSARNFTRILMGRSFYSPTFLSF